MESRINKRTIGETMETVTMTDRLGNECKFDGHDLYGQLSEQGHKIFGYSFKGIIELRKAMLKCAVPQPFTDEKIVEFLKPLTDLKRLIPSGGDGEYNIDALMKFFEMRWQWGDKHDFGRFDVNSKEFNEAVYMTLRNLDTQRLKLLAFKQKIKEIIKEVQE